MWVFYSQNKSYWKYFLYILVLLQINCTGIVCCWWCSLLGWKPTVLYRILCLLSPVNHLWKKSGPCGCEKWHILMVHVELLCRPFSALSPYHEVNRMLPSISSRFFPLCNCNMYWICYCRWCNQSYTYGWNIRRLY